MKEKQRGNMQEGLQRRREGRREGGWKAIRKEGYAEEEKVIKIKEGKANEEQLDGRDENQ